MGRRDGLHADRRWLRLSKPSAPHGTCVRMCGLLASARPTDELRDRCEGPEGENITAAAPKIAPTIVPFTRVAGSSSVFTITMPTATNPSDTSRDTAAVRRDRRNSTIPKRSRVSDHSSWHEECSVNETSVSARYSVTGV